MSRVLYERKGFAAAPLGEPTPLPDFADVSYVHSTVSWDDTLSEEDVRHMRYGRIKTILPYCMQSNYGRSLESESRGVVCLENARVRAEFLPWMGGRLWSLRVDGRELLSVNPVIQPCNLALRGAWCSGGVEWNMGVRGHSVFTCEPLFTELLELPDGTSGVRFYEYDRIRGSVFCLEGYLPPESALLFVQVRLVNPVGNGETPMYWWSNIAVPETQSTRVIAPASTAILSLYQAGQYQMLRRELPEYEGMDVSRPTAIRRSLDVFYDIPAGQRPYIAALDEERRGLVQFSSAFQRGRKLFVWGMGAGGRHWQSFLSHGQARYLEIQAGIARTQQDHLPMPDGAEWTWLEAYGELNCDVRGMEWARAAQACTQAVEALLPAQAFAQEQAVRGRQIAQCRGELAVLGSGWGCLENERRAAAGLPPLDKICRFPAKSVRQDMSAWADLLRQGTFPEADPLSRPYPYAAWRGWLAPLEALPEKNSAAWYHIGVLRHAKGDRAGARAALESSVRARPNPWALRCLARLERQDGRDGLERYRQALALRPDCWEIALEYARALLESGQPEAFLAYRETLPDSWKNTPRFLYLEADARMETGDYARSRAILLAPLVIPDMQEGELSLSHLWQKLHSREFGIPLEEAAARFPLPYELDYRMHAE